MAKPKNPNIKDKPKNVVSAIHDPKTNELHVTFGNGSVYSYSNVDAKKHLDMMKSPSLGSFLHQHIIPKHQVSNKKIK